MPATYTYDVTLALDLDRVRFLTGDTGTSPDDGVTVEWLYANEEIAYTLSVAPNLIDAAARLLDQSANRYARLADKQVGELKVSLGQKSKAFRDQAAELREQYGGGDLGVAAVLPYAGGLSLTDVINDLSDPDLKQPAFRRGMHDEGGNASHVRSPIVIYPPGS